MTEELITVETRPCVLCGRTHQLTVRKSAFEAWQAGGHIQHVMTELTPGERELLMTGTCEPCFDEAFGEEDE